mmetsp:Transcript_52543/g.139463  ORF Transcript_52543/g.139463 Transcript_52543/m.139463 type:complete len:196 (+) Transcript_52543:92-679(+)
MLVFRWVVLVRAVCAGVLQHRRTQPPVVHLHASRFLSPLPKVQVLVQEPFGLLPEGRTTVDGPGGLLGAEGVQEAADAMEQGGDAGWQAAARLLSLADSAEGRAALLKGGILPVARKLMTRESTPEEGRVVVGSLLAGISGRPASATVYEPLSEDESVVDIVMPNQKHHFDIASGHDEGEKLDGDGARDLPSAMS